MTDQSEDADTFGLLSTLPAPEGYTKQDQYRDFRLVFLGSEDGKRVLRQLLAWCHLLRPSLMGSPIDPYAMAVLEAERNLGLKLTLTLTVEPREQPTQTQRRPK